MKNEFFGVKLLDIHAQMSYPIVTAYEFYFLRNEEVVKKILDNSTIYLIVQRPLLYIENLTTDEGVLKFTITDCMKVFAIECTLDPHQAALGIAEDEDFLLDVQFYTKDPSPHQPYNKVAAIRFLRLDSSFIAWLTPQKIIFEYVAGIIKMEVKGDVMNFSDYKVHYIGQAFNQKIWNRLTGHEKMQDVLTLEDSINDMLDKNSFEISLILLEVTGYSESNMFPLQKNMIKDYPKACLFKLETEDEFVKFNDPILEANAPELTNEIEALLISSFKPHYNKIKFSSYPDIKKGVRSVGYAAANLTIERIPVKLYTDSYTQEVVLYSDI